MSFDFISKFFNFRRVGDVKEEANKILDDAEKTDDEKIKGLLGLEALKSAMSGMNLDESSKLAQFLTRQDVLEQVVRYALQVPANPEDKDESYKFPNLAQELICNSSLLCQVLLEGGRGIPQEPPKEDVEESTDAQSTQVTLGDENTEGESSVKSKTLENPKVVVKS